MKKVEEVARALAERNGDKFDELPKHKSHWTEKGGMFGGVFRDVNRHFQCDYLDDARAAIEAMKNPSFEVMQAMHEAMFEDKWDATQAAMIGAGFDAAIDAALTDGGE